MSGSWPKIIRDPVHDIVLFEDNACDRLLLDLINTREFQRLRRIKQLGMSELVFPGTNHSRFAHSIGVMHNARRFLDRLAKVCDEGISVEHRTAVLAASLLHDVGHGPFSHTFEKITGEDHEARTLQVIRDNSTEVCKRLKKHSKELPEVLAAFFDEDMEEDRRDAAMPPHLTQVVSSQLDADRFDYLLRDSYATGTDYGHFDAGWHIEHLHLDGQKKRLFLSHKALMAAEAYVFARSRMYRTVYYHKTTRAAEVMLRLVLKRYKELLQKARSAKAKEAVAPGAPPGVLAAFSGSLTLGDYLAFDDHAISEFLKRCAYASDPVLQSSGVGLAERKLFKAVEASDAQAADVGRFTTAASQAISKAHLDQEYSFVEDSPGDTPYKPCDPDDTKPATQIYAQTTLGEIIEISKQSPAVHVLRSKYSLLRYYFPQSIRTTIEKIAKTTIIKETRK
jgi:HD superfamily phosphohydrolase